VNGCTIEWASCGLFNHLHRGNNEGRDPGSQPRDGTICERFGGDMNSPLEGIGWREGKTVSDSGKGGVMKTRNTDA